MLFLAAYAVAIATTFVFAISYSDIAGKAPFSYEQFSYVSSIGIIYIILLALVESF